MFLESKNMVITELANKSAIFCKALITTYVDNSIFVLLIIKSSLNIFFYLYTKLDAIYSYIEHILKISIIESYNYNMIFKNNFQLTFVNNLFYTKLHTQFS